MTITKSFKARAEELAQAPFYKIKLIAEEQTVYGWQTKDGETVNIDRQTGKRKPLRKYNNRKVERKNRC